MSYLDSCGLCVPVRTVNSAEKRRREKRREGKREERERERRGEKRRGDRRMMRRVRESMLVGRVRGRGSKEAQPRFVETPSLLRQQPGLLSPPDGDAATDDLQVCEDTSISSNVCVILFVYFSFAFFFLCCGLCVGVCVVKEVTAIHSVSEISPTRFS